jgi:deazaflavin-dependent oxidoreductase (nitroreductase family)
MTTPGYVKPPWGARVIGSRMARLFKPQVVSLLRVRGRRSGEWRSAAVAVLTVGGHDFLMSAYGQTEWSRNLRAAGTAQLTRRRRTETITVEEVPAEDVPALMTEYLRQFGKLPTVGKTFDALPDAADHPTFRITSAATAGPSRRS